MANSRVHYGLRPERSKLEDLYINQRMDSVEIGIIYCVHGTTVTKWLKQYGIPRRGVGRHLPTKEQIEPLWNASYTTDEICNQLGIGTTTLYRLAKRYGLPHKPATDRSGPNNPRWLGGGYTDDYGPGYDSIREQVLDCDDHRCRRCGVTRDELGKEPDTHHIIPFRTFNGDYLRANVLSNLITLCPRCHTFTEHHPELPLPAEPDPRLRLGVIMKPRKVIQPPKVDPQEVARRYQAGEPVAATMKALDIGGMTYYRSLKRAGIETNRQHHVNPVLVRQMIADGLTRKEVAAKLGINLATTYKLCPPPTPLARRPETTLSILQLYARGMGARAIAKTVGVGRSFVQKVIRAHQPEQTVAA